MAAIDSSSGNHVQNSSTVPATPRGVSFAQPIANYRQLGIEDDELSFSSDDSEQESNFYDSAQLTQREVERSERGLVESTYLERIDYKALLATLRTSEAHDTAQHLYSVAMLKRLSPAEYDAITNKKLRAGWTAWPLSAGQTKHSVNADGELLEQLQAVLHRKIYSRLRSQSKEIVSDELPAAVSEATASVILSKLNRLLESVGQVRSAQCSKSLSTVKRMEVLNHEDILRLFHHMDTLSQSVRSRVDARVFNLFGTTGAETETVQATVTIPSSPTMTIDEVKLGAGRWSTRGHKRRRVLTEDDSEGSNRKSVNRKLKAELITADSGKRFEKNVRLVPAHLVKQENSDI